MYRLSMESGRSAFFFASMKVSPQVGDVYRNLMGLAQWPFRLMADPQASLTTVTMTPDPTDLFVLPALAIAWWIGTQTCSRTAGNSATLS